MEPLRLSPSFRYTPPAATASSRSPSRSPHRRQQFTTKVLDPLLSDLSRTSTFEALEATCSGPETQTTRNVLQASITAASASERALGLRAALAGKKLREWLQELEGWRWPTDTNGFEPPLLPLQLSEEQQEKEFNLRQELADPHLSYDNFRKQPEFWGCLPAQTARGYSNRVEEIRDDMEALELDGLKTFVKKSYFFSTPRRLLMSGMSEKTDADYAYPHVDDFTAVVTTTILQSLPIMFRLEALLVQWEVRLTVLEHVSGFLQQIDQAKQAMASAWGYIEDLGTQTTKESFLGKTSISRMQASLEWQISDVGKRLDCMLDSLEGKSDRLPDHWIDDMDGLQSDFSVWVVEAEKFALETELEMHKLSAGHAETLVKLNAHKKPSLHSEQLSEGLTKPKTTSSSLSPQGTAEEQSDNQSFPTSKTGQKASPSVSVPRSIQVAEANTPSKRASRPRTLDLRSQNSDAHLSSDFSSDASWPGSATSDYFSNVPSPELQDAAKAEYFGLPTSIEVITPSFVYRSSKGSEDAVSRQSSQRTARGDRQYLDGSLSPTLTSSHQRSRASTVVIDGTIDEDSPTAEEPPLDYHTLLSEIELGSTPIESRLIKNSSNHVVSKEPGETQWQHASGDTKTVNPQPSTPRTPTSYRTRHSFGNEDGPGNVPAKLLHKKSGSPRRGRNSQNNASDQFEKRISSILTNIPASIRLTSGSDPDTPDAARSTVSPQPKRIFKRSFAPQLTRAHTTVLSPPAMTLAPVNERMSPMQNGEPEVKLYHLHQSGKEAPIKLFVRLVGEGGERVMVRVGGGWADLGEYLKEYATHHGRRTLSDGRVDIQGLPQSHSSSPVPTLSTFSSAQVTPKSRPESPVTERSGGNGPKPRRLSALSSTAHLISGSSSLKEGGRRPESRDSSAPSNHRWSGEDSPSLGLAGPKSKRINISPNKQAWVDTMLDRARHSSNEKRRTTPETFGDLGIIGGTKRLFMKSKKES
ncbi:MAG: hypothetical protein Q9167_007533 [Letrouitia subvulpina]